MMFGVPLGFVVEALVAVLLALTIGYCIVLNERLKRLHSDRDMLRKMVTDLVQATDLANMAIKELKATASDADLTLSTRLQEAERFGVELANHITAGTSVMDRIARITSAARTAVPTEPTPEAGGEASKVQSALQQLSLRPRIRGNAA